MSITNTDGERAWRHSDGRAFHLSAARKETECKPYREKVCGRTKAAVDESGIYELLLGNMY